MASLQEWLDRLSGVVQRGDRHMALCPAHADKNPSLSVQQGDDGWVKVHCFAGCDESAVEAAIGLTRSPDTTRVAPGTASNAQPSPRNTQAAPPKPQPLPRSGPSQEVYRYYNADGSDAFAVVRRDLPTGRKTFSQWTPVIEGAHPIKEGYPPSDTGWIPIGLPNNRPLYRLPQIINQGKVVVVEGEKCVHAVLTAWPSQHVTTWAGGTNAWQLADWTPLAGKEVSILADADDDSKHRAGQRAALAIAAHLHELGCKVRVGIPEPDDSNDVADWLTKGKDYARGFIATLLTDFDPAMLETAEEPEAPPIFEEKEGIGDYDSLVGNQHYRLLGLAGDAVAIRISAGRIMQRTRESLTRDSTLVALAPLTWWTGLTGKPLTSGTARELGDALIRAADSKGQIDLTQIYGRGAARLSDGQVVYHLGDRLLIGGEEQPLDCDSRIWLAEPPIPTTEQATTAQRRAIAESVMQYRWATPVHGKRMLGWVVAAIVGGALEWRPHLMLSAPSGVGKSWIQREVVARIMGPLLQRISDATPAALARLTAHAALPIAVDEAEPSREWVMELLTLLRIASGSEGQRIRADSMSGGIQVQMPRFAAMLSSIATPRMSQADITRQVQVRLGEEVEDWPTVRDAILGGMAYADNVRTSIIHSAPALVRDTSAMADELQNLGMDSREALSQAAITVGWHWWGVDDSDVPIREDEERGRSEAADLLSSILALQMRDPGGAGKTVARALDSDAAYVADLFGIRHDDRGLFIDYAHPGLASALGRTPWGNVNLRGILRDLEGVEITNPLRIGSRRKRTLHIPKVTLEALGVEIDVDIDTGDE